MMNSPCAMLITFIWPNVNVSPSATSSRMDAMLSPTKSWLRMVCIVSFPLLGRSWSVVWSWVVLGGLGGLVVWRSLGAGVGRRETLGPVVGLQARVGLDRPVGLEDRVDQPVLAQLADAGRLVDVLV